MKPIALLLVVICIAPAPRKGGQQLMDMAKRGARQKVAAAQEAATQKLVAPFTNVVKSLSHPPTPPAFAGKYQTLTMPSDACASLVGQRDPAGKVLWYYPLVWALDYSRDAKNWTCIRSNLSCHQSTNSDIYTSTLTMTNGQKEFYRLRRQGPTYTL